MKNIILDVGGILFDDSKENISRLLNKEADSIYKVVYGKGFKECLLGYKTVNQYIDSLLDNTNFEDLKYILSKENLKLSYPLITENYEYIKSLKNKGYKLIIKRYNLDLNETIFFDDSQKNIDAAIKEGIKSIKFNSINEIEEFIKGSE